MKDASHHEVSIAFSQHFTQHSIRHCQSRGKFDIRIFIICDKM